MSSSTASAKSSASPRHCLNCGAALTHSFCASCGQRADVGPLRFRVIVSDLVDSLLDFEQPILRTTVGLLVAPGRVARAWIEGQRRRYTNPMKYCVISGVVSTLAMQLFPALMGATDPAVVHSGDLAEFAMNVFTEYLGFLVIVLAIPLGWLTGLVGRIFKLPRSGLDWYVLALFTFGIGVPVQLLVGLAGPIGRAFSGMVPIVYFMWAAWAFSGRDHRWASLFVAFIGTIAWIVFLAVSLGSLKALLS